jgi:hypothetical protein
MRYDGEKGLNELSNHEVLPGLIDCHTCPPTVSSHHLVDRYAYPVGWENFLMPFEGTLSSEDAPDER